ncbi:hypothetical protein HRR90_001715 [Exophiala dermatitidis]|uniref:HIRAN domain-containing protein n=1 Tax=Exophiala dermatitidis TaxID=5970 RepID=A0AAN6EYH1_EXODE|nr:hypothetical protein HRR73_000646 [Exophiala dermatitidis]KAJ4543216.1 hypothetical protein HRR77_005473 [Exophiala dermatitidis]KAJ4543715.1 hypothetical protein HRR76_001781 [Exophiala dermatitidis]KAJ4575181.1 hypothetical protein HRR79_002111 [Exophiala dermatitidis]KAJ4587750.1 hypothetical protein HRR82_001549 [Exophiala dermatitidis]
MVGFAGVVIVFDHEQPRSTRRIAWEGKLWTWDSFFALVRVKGDAPLRDTVVVRVLVKSSVLGFVPKSIDRSTGRLIAREESRRGEYVGRYSTIESRIRIRIVPQWYTAQRTPSSRASRGPTL